MARRSAEGGPRPRPKGTHLRLLLAGTPPAHAARRITERPRPADLWIGALAPYSLAGSMCGLAATCGLGRQGPNGRGRTSPRARGLLWATGLTGGASKA